MVFACSGAGSSAKKDGRTTTVRRAAPEAPTDETTAETPTKTPTAAPVETPVPTETPTPTATPTPSSADQVVFVTSSINNGNLGGVSGADTICQTLAQSQKFTYYDSFKAILSSTTTSALTHIGVTTNVYNTRNELVKSSFAAMFNANPALVSLDNVFSYDQGGNPIPNWGNSWTGTLATGSVAGTHCSDWTSSSGVATGVSGYQFDDANALNYTNSQWVNNTTNSCSDPIHHFCIGLNARAASTLVSIEIVESPANSGVLLITGSNVSNLQAIGTYADGSTRNISNLVTWTWDDGVGTWNITASGVWSSTDNIDSTGTVTATLGPVSETVNADYTFSS